MRRTTGCMAWILVCAFTACSVDDVDLDGKLCSPSAPCPDGLACVAGHCEIAESSCGPTFPVENLRVGWRTPNTIQWTWQPRGAPEDFVQYKLVLAKTPAELAQAAERALAGQADGQGGAIWTQDDNPELGQYELRLSGNVDPVTSTITDGLDAGVEYRAQLLSYDRQGCVSRSAEAVGRTEAAPLVEFTLFDERNSSLGKPRPDGITSIESDASRAYAGEDFLSWPGWTALGRDGAEYENVGAYDLRSVPSTDYPSLDMSSGYVELAVSVDGAAVAAWGEARLIFGPTPGSCSEIEPATIKPLAIRAGGYQLLQLPLREFLLGGQPLTDATLRTRAVCEVSVGRTWVPGETVRVDAIRLKW
ncbi:MAG: hypothetical protein AB7K71_06810 [Polyangiaceae bacterium]